MLGHPLRVVILFFADPDFDYTVLPFPQKMYRDAYTEFSRIAKIEGVHLYRAATDWFDTSTRCFRQAWHWDGINWKVEKNVIPDCIYDKSPTSEKLYDFKKGLATLFPMVNTPDFSLHAGSKLLVSEAFPNFAKRYFLVNNKNELTDILSNINSSRIVLKPERGNSGKGITIIEKGNLQQETLVYPLLVQEFVDSSQGIPGVMVGSHDLRLIYVDEKFIYAYYRTPQEGSLLSNVAQGGTQTMVKQEKIPSSVWSVVRAVQTYYQAFQPKVYTIDFIFDRDRRPWIVELNTMPGLYPDASERGHIQKLYRAIIGALRSAQKLPRL